MNAKGGFYGSLGEMASSTIREEKEVRNRHFTNNKNVVRMINLQAIMQQRFTRTTKKKGIEPELHPPLSKGFSLQTLFSHSLNPSTCLELHLSSSKWGGSTPSSLLSRSSGFVSTPLRRRVRPLFYLLYYATNSCFLKLQISKILHQCIIDHRD